MAQNNVAENENGMPLYGNIIVVEGFGDKSKKSNEKPQKNYDHERHEAYNGEVEPIRNPEDLQKILSYFFDNQEYRNWCIFYVGINCGLRASDLLRLKISDVANPQLKGGYRVKDNIRIHMKPKKTAYTGKYVTITLSPDVRMVIQRYLNLTGSPGGIYENYFKSGGWLFPSGKGSSKNSKRNVQKCAGDPIDVDSYGKILKNEIQRGLDLPINIGTHSMRKTFGYRFFRQNQENVEALAMLQRMFNHTSQRTTLSYIGIAQEEIDELYQSFDCGVDISGFVKE